MKKILLLVILCPLIACAQQQEKEPVKKGNKPDKPTLETFSAETGTLIEKTFINVGKIGSAKVQILVLRDLISGVKTKGLRFEKPTGKQYGGNAISFIDEDEVDGLMKSIVIIQEKVLPTVPSDYQEVNFNSRSGFAAGCYWSKNKWSSYLKIDKSDADSYIWLGDGELDTFNKLLIDAKAKLNSI
ncbi:hypothetical protein RYH73_01340 [Olivibacter sp. CPCC 100613]|uniref:hypothetical protein n=1 Tax=Olivibacter sp. CPCC 100613 TaxID=3079931 RepID=UPI002FF66981